MRRIAVVLVAGCGRIGIDPLPDAPSTTGVPVFAVSANVYTTCAIIEGVLSCWGSNTRGQIAPDLLDRFAPTPMGADRDWIAVVPGQDHTCGLRGTGDLYCWGGNDQGQLGVGDFTDRPAPHLDAFSLTYSSA